MNIYIRCIIYVSSYMMVCINFRWVKTKCICVFSYGPNVAYSSPVSHHGYDQTPVYYSRQAIERADVPEGYKLQYVRTATNKDADEPYDTKYDNATSISTKETHAWNSRYAPAKPQLQLFPDTTDDENVPARVWPMNTVV